MKKTLLKNPFVVAGLVIIALGFVFVNNILPYMKSDEIPEDIVTVDSIAQQTQNDIPVESGLIVQDGTQPVINTSLLKNNVLKMQGWIRTSSRDPFENSRSDSENEKQSIVTADNKADDRNIGIAVNNVTNKGENKNINKPRVKTPSILKAISIGTAEKVALIGSAVYHEGDTCSIGVVKKIDPDSVIIAGSNGIRILHLK